MLPRLVFAFALSLALHASLLLPEMLKRRPVAPPRPALQANLRLPPMPDIKAADSFEPLLKNTLEDESTKQAADQPTKPLPQTKNQPKRSSSIKTQAVQRKLSKYVFYPEAARANGIEGTVHLYLEIAQDGTIEDVRIAQSSGYPILDNAAAKGAWAVQKLPNTKTGTYDYVFKLID